ncbi:MAG: 3-deoxy-7-phosphoheptulonate synthase [Planctomycetota bacterium]
MPDRIENSNVLEANPLIAPRQLKANLPLTEKGAATVLKARQAVRDIIHGRDQRRILMVVGPCSVHDTEAAFDYAEKLSAVAKATENELVIVMRTYFEKPRTTVGWKGLINDPHLDGSCDIETGLGIARRLMLRVNELGLPCASELLDPVTPQYTADLISWAAIGARTTESQTHREMASGLSMPVGFKNGTDGGLEVALNAMVSASHPHSFLGINPDGITAVIKTKGNPDRHIVLRGGGGKTNYSPADIAIASEKVLAMGIKRPVMVDCSHGNTNKDYTLQGNVCKEVMKQAKAGQKSIMGVMMESNLKPGKQNWKEDGSLKLEYGMSITDACIGWDETKELLLEAAEAVRGA